MNCNTKNFTKKISIFLAALLIGFNTVSLTARAAEPTVQVTTSKSAQTVSNENDQEKTDIADLQITDLEEPAGGKLLDNYATVRASRGVFWTIPVIWLDDDGQISSVCIPHRNYTPIFAFYIPQNYVVIGPNGSSDFSVKLPEFVEKLYGEKSFLSIANPLSGITYITTSSIVKILGSERGAGIFNSPELKQYSTIARMSGVRDLVATGNALSNEIWQNVSEQENSYDEPESGTNAPDSDDDQDQEEGSADQPQGGSDEGQGGSEDDPVKPEVDLVAIHCSDKVINELGKDNMSKFLNLIMNVIEPQAVYWLENSFSSYGEGAKKNALGKEIGLYIYDSRFTSDPKRDTKGALAYVSSDMTTDKDDNSIYGYYVAVNTETLYEKNADGNYELKTDEIDNLNNTLVHEMMHAFMDDYTRTGMEGYSNEALDYTADENKFPNWFIEGTATTVDNVYTYRNDIFGAMHTDTSDALSDYSIDSLLKYYKNYNDKDYGSPSIDTTNKYYDTAQNAASAYVSGYLACLYLSNMAVNKGYVQDITTAKTIDDEGNVSFSSVAIKGGLDAILGMLHDGYSLDYIVNDISNGKYTSTESFQNTFLTGTYNEESQKYEDCDASASFCVDFLNYMNRVSKNLTGDSENVVFANGSILLDFGTEFKSPFSGELPDDMPRQDIFTIADSRDHVTSTVDNDVAWHTAGVKGPAVPTNDQNDDSNAPQEEEDGQAAARTAEVAEKDTAEGLNEENEIAESESDVEKTEATDEGSNKEELNDQATGSNNEELNDQATGSDSEELKETATAPDNEESKEPETEADDGKDQTEAATGIEDNKIIEDAQYTPTVNQDQTNITDSSMPVSDNNTDESIPEDPKPQLPDEPEDNNDNESDDSNNN
ncbi:hypothetical protein [Butyrivibrio proteoclasticus]|uniref:hypothetical protein n=1 Tax=Butyrivibrio proteoclasticus TaxID=43305 RepID=UPI00047ED5CE|nr:hypothetical protein [Butyrivibrio proteoclasticus]